jgi:hypothetical protein
VGCVTQGWELLFYGDSILEDFRETWVGDPKPTVASGIGAVWDRHFARKYRSHVLAIAGAWGSMHLASLAVQDAGASRQHMFVCLSI